jgi:uncharacterized membrane protein
MPYVEQSIVIQSPPEAVFDLIANQPERMPEWWHAFEAQTRVTPPPTVVGSVSRYVYNMMGVRIKGEHQVVEIEDNARLLVKTLSGIDGLFEFSFDAVNGGTELTVRVDYALPGSVLGQLLNRLTIEHRNERDLLEGLQNLKQIVEMETQP